MRFAYILCKFLRHAKMRDPDTQPRVAEKSEKLLGALLLVVVVDDMLTKIKPTSGLWPQTEVGQKIKVDSNSYKWGAFFWAPFILYV